MTVGLRHLKERVNLTDRWHKVRHERPEFSVEVDLLGFEPLNVFKQFLHFPGDRQVSVLSRVVSAGNFFFILVVIFVIFSCLALLLSGTGLSGRLLLLLSWLLLSEVDVYLILFLFGVDLLGIVDIYGQVERLVLNFFSFDGGTAWGRGLGSLRGVGLLGAGRDAVGGLLLGLAHVLALIGVVEVVVAEIERISTLLGKAII